VHVGVCVMHMYVCGVCGVCGGVVYVVCSGASVSVSEVWCAVCCMVYDVV